MVSITVENTYPEWCNFIKKQKKMNRFWQFIGGKIFKSLKMHFLSISFVYFFCCCIRKTMWTHFPFAGFNHFLSSFFSHPWYEPHPTNVIALFMSWQYMKSHTHTHTFLYLELHFHLLTALKFLISKTTPLHKLSLTDSHSVFMSVWKWEHSRSYILKTSEQQHRGLWCITT